MKTDRELNRQDAFLYVFRHLQRFREVVENLNKAVYEAYDYYDGFPGDPENWPEEEQKALEGIWDKVADDAMRLREMIQAPLLTMLTTPEGYNSWRDEVDQALVDISLYVDPESPEADLADADKGAYALTQAIDLLEEHCDHLAVTVFGRWGLYWFKIATESKRIDEIVTYLDRFDQVPLQEVVAVLESPEQLDNEQSQKVAEEERNEWIYDEYMAGVKFPVIIDRLKGKPIEWDRIFTRQGIRDAARRHASRHGLPMPLPRRPGRPPK